MDNVDVIKVNGIMKAWIFQFMVIPRLSWGLFIHDLDVSFGNDLNETAVRYLKKWIGLSKSVDLGILFRSRENFGLGLTSIDNLLKKMQLTRYFALCDSKDEGVRELMLAKSVHEKEFKKRWTAAKIAPKAVAEFEFREKFPSQFGRSGIGVVKRLVDPPPKLRRKLLVSLALEMEDNWFVHAQTLSQQGVWTKWHDNSLPLDLSWKNLIYGAGINVLRFALNASINWTVTPDLLNKMNYIKNANCTLCGYSQCTQFHILVDCPAALHQKRYTWRHDSVLNYIKKLIGNHLKALPPISKKFISFLRAGEKVSTSKNKRNWLSVSDDWKLLVDMDHEKIVFPPEILSTSKRPDIVIWSKKTKTVIIGELTCPAEENFQAARLYKEARYEDLNASASEKGWNVILRTIEVGARGFVAKTVPYFFRNLGFEQKIVKKVCKDVSEISLRCSYHIFLSAKVKEWERNYPLFELFSQNEEKIMK